MIPLWQATKQITKQMITTGKAPSLEQFHEFETVILKLSIVLK